MQLPISIPTQRVTQSATIPEDIHTIIDVMVN